MARIPFDAVIEQIAERYQLYTQANHSPVYDSGQQRNRPAPSSRQIDYEAIAFFSGLSSTEVKMMHNAPNRFIMDGGTAEALGNAFGISERQALGYEPILQQKHSIYRNPNVHSSRLQSELQSGLQKEAPEPKDRAPRHGTPRHETPQHETPRHETKVLPLGHGFGQPNTTLGNNLTYHRVLNPALNPALNKDDPSYNHASYVKEPEPLADTCWPPI